MKSYQKLYDLLIETGEGPTASRVSSVPKKRRSSETERPGDARIAALQALVSKHFEGNPDDEGADEHEKKGPAWKDKRRKKK